MRDGERAEYLTGSFLFDRVEVVEGFVVLRRKAGLGEVFGGFVEDVGKRYRRAGFDFERG